MSHFFMCQECFKWSCEPKGFDIRVHFVRCTCNRLMYRTQGDPVKDYAMPKKDEVQATIVNQ